KVAQIDIVAEGSADNLAARIDDQHDLWLWVVPYRLRMQTDVGAETDRGHRLRLGEHLGVRPDADLEILRPESMGGQRRFEPRSVFRSRANLGEGRADLGHQAFAPGGRLAWVAPALFFDHPFDEAGRERNAGGLDRLQIDWCEEPG